MWLLPLLVSNSVAQPGIIKQGLVGNLYRRIPRKHRKATLGMCRRCTYLRVVRDSCKNLLHSDLANFWLFFTRIPADSPPR